MRMCTMLDGQWSNAFFTLSQFAKLEDVLVFVVTTAAASNDDDDDLQSEDFKLQWTLVLRFDQFHETFIV